jgi:hypothetical protein
MIKIFWKDQDGVQSFFLKFRAEESMKIWHNQLRQLLQPELAPALPVADAGSAKAALFRTTSDRRTKEPKDEKEEQKIPNQTVSEQRYEEKLVDSKKTPKIPRNESRDEFYSNIQDIEDKFNALFNLESPKNSIVSRPSVSKGETSRPGSFSENSQLGKSKSKRFKIHFNNDLHMLYLPCPGGMPYSELREKIMQKIQKTNDAESAGLKIRYEDEDKDFVVISCDDDVQLMLSLYDDSNVIHLYIS